MALRVTPGLACDGDGFASLVRLYTGDNILADRVRAAKITPLILCQPLPQLDADAAALLRTHKPLLCEAAGVPCLPHCVPPALEPAPPPAAARGLRPATYLHGKRLRVSRRAKLPHFRRLSDDCVACNGCGAAMKVRSDAELAGLAFGPAWHELHWKTFLCRECHDRARIVIAAKTDACHSCYGRRSGPITHIPLRYARADNATQPRVLTLCATCVTENSAQLATVRYRPPPDS